MKKIDHNPCRHNWPFKGILLSALIVIFSLSDVMAGVLVSPTVIFLSNRSRTGRMTVQNPTDTKQEVTVRFSFGLPESDSLGNIRVNLNDSISTDPNSALGWLKAFPRKMNVEPNATQIIRFVASPPKEIPDGEYWARVIVRARAAETEIPSATDENAITTRLNMVMQTAIMLKFRQGELVSQIEVTDLQATPTPENVEVMVDISSKGTASYIGMLHCRLLDANNNEISKTATQLAVYHDIRRRLNLPLKGNDFKKPFQIELYITNKGRNDIAAEDMISGNEVTLTQTVD